MALPPSGGAAPAAAGTGWQLKSPIGERPIDFGLAGAKLTRMKGAKEGGHDIVVIGCSAGGVEALSKLFAKFPRKTKAAFFVVMHIGATSESYLPRIIGRVSKLPAVHAEDGEKIEHGRIYVAPPDRHLMLTGKKVALCRGPKENRHRPAVDPLFRSAAQHFGPRVIGVILTGSLDDGTTGLQAIKRCGGLAVVQHPDDAMAWGMPTSALQYVEVDHVTTLAKMGSLLGRLIGKLPSERPEPGCHEVASSFNQKETMTEKEMNQKFAAPSGLVCPECSGPVWEIAASGHSQFQCMVGHAFSPESFLAEDADAAERALWVAVKTLQQRANLLRRMADKATGTVQSISAARFRKQAEESEVHAAAIRNILKRFDASPQQNQKRPKSSQ